MHEVRGNSNGEGEGSGRVSEGVGLNGAKNGIGCLCTVVYSTDEAFLPPVVEALCNVINMIQLRLLLMVAWLLVCRQRLSLKLCGQVDSFLLQSLHFNLCMLSTVNSGANQCSPQKII